MPSAVLKGSGASEVDSWSTPLIWIQSVWDGPQKAAVSASSPGGHSEADWSLGPTQRNPLTVYWVFMPKWLVRRKAHWGWLSRVLSSDLSQLLPSGVALAGSLWPVSSWGTDWMNSKGPSSSKRKAFEAGPGPAHQEWNCVLSFYITSLLKCSWFTMFQVYSKVMQLYMCVCVCILFRFFSHRGYYRILSRVPVLCSRSLLIIYFVYSSVYLFISNS